MVFILLHKQHTIISIDIIYLRGLIENEFEKIDTKLNLILHVIERGVKLILFSQ